MDGVGTNRYTYTAAGQLATEDGPFASDTVTNIYSNRLRREMDLQQPAGLWTNTFAWDAVKRLTNVTSTAGSFGYQYEPSFPTRLIAKLSFPNTAYISNSFDSDARLLGTYLKNNSGTVLDSYEYAYNPASPRTNLTRADSTTAAYTYDRIGQLTVDNDSAGGGYNRGYAYDASWNMLRRTNFLEYPPGNVLIHTNDSRNELTGFNNETLQYDPNGNLTNRYSGDFVLFTYTYDDENRLVFMEYDDWGTPYYQLNQMEYDGLGRLRSATEYIYDGTDWVPNGVKTYIYDGWRVIQERDGNNTPLVSYTRGSDLSGTLEGAGGIGGLLARSCGYSGGNWSTNSYYFADGIGNIVCMLDGSQSMVAKYRYDPFGYLLTASGSMASENSYWFSSKEIHVNSGMYYYGYRWYDPSLQRWINRDPLADHGFRRSLSRTQSIRRQIRTELTLFPFVSNDPLDRFDPLGLSQGILGIPGTGGTCCNRTSSPEFWLDDGVWKPLPPHSCTGFSDDCDGHTCQGGFYAVSDLSSHSCKDNQCSLGNLSLRWTPNSPGPLSTPPGPQNPGDPPGRGGPLGNPPPKGYQWDPN